MPSHHKVFPTTHLSIPTVLQLSKDNWWPSTLSYMTSVGTEMAVWIFA